MLRVLRGENVGNHALADLPMPFCARSTAFGRHGATLLASAMLALTVGVAGPAAAAPGAGANGKSAPAKVQAEPQTKAEMVATPFQFPVGSIVIVNAERRLYYITGKGEARRYRVAVGKNEELWMGRTFIASKAVDPKWIPVNGDDPVEGGDPANPLGKRALYLDWSLLRIHGTPSRGSIGAAVSNGCIRMLNEDVMDLFDRVHLGAAVYAIKSWKDATRFTEIKVAEKVYADPEARKIAKAREAEEMADQAEERAERERERRRLAEEKARAEARMASRAQPFPNVTRYGLGRGAW